MLGSLQKEGEGSSTIPGRNISRRMHSAIIAADSKSFFKDGRRISVGDCALFKPPQDSPPFIGLIRCLALSKENNLQLSVNWLYRPVELKLGKGTLLNTAPTEIFYSFHKDKILAASLLHPCKVAFLPRGVELPTGTSSFVCRRVYDIANKCLWWLTDQDYINEQQEEVDQLLCKTKIAMHAEPGARSPKQVNGPTSTSQLKPGSDNVQNSGTSFPSQVKRKKRERGDNVADTAKRERSSRNDGGDSAHHKTESYLKIEIGRLTEKGGVVELEGIDKLVQLMQLDRMEKKIDLSGRLILAGVIAAIDKVDCLNRFVQLRGLPVLDEWLQSIHKGKIGDGTKDNDKSIEELLLVLLRALDKIPVNLHALQMCNIGRSVNHLRSHKNFEIQRKARSLVDTWKKRVEAEMNSIDTKSGSAQSVSVWPSKSRLPEASHGGSRTPTQSDVATKSSITHHSASKIIAKTSHGDSITRSAYSSLRPASSPASFKESQPRMSVGDVSAIREDRSSSSNQSLSYSQSFLGKDEGKSSTAAVSKVSSCSFGNKKFSGFPVISVTGDQKETSPNRISPAHRSTALSQSALMSQRVFEGPTSEGSSHKLIVKIPNRGRSPAKSVSGASLGDPSIMNSRASSPVLLDKNEQFDVKDKRETNLCNVTSDVNVESGENSGLPAGLPDEVLSTTTSNSRRSIEGPRKNQLKSGNLHNASFSPMNALIESCVRYSEAHSSLSLEEDDVGMNLLASVAAGEISRSNLVSPPDSTKRSTPAVEEISIGDDAKPKSSLQNHIEEGQIECNKKAVLDGLDLCNRPSVDTSGEMKCGQSHTPADRPTGEGNKHCGSLVADLRSTPEAKLEIVEKLNEKTDTRFLAFLVSPKKIRDGVENKEIHEEKGPRRNVSANGISNCQSSEANVVVAEDKVDKDLFNTDKGKPMVEVAFSNPSFEDECKNDINGPNTGTILQQKLSDAVVKSEFSERANNEKPQHTTSGWKLMSEAEVKVGESDAESCISKLEIENANKKVDRNTVVDDLSAAGSFSIANDLKIHHIEVNVDSKEKSEHKSLPEGGFPASVAHEAKKNDELIGFKSAGIVTDEAESTSTSAGASDSGVKIKFDLNEGFAVDDGKYVEPGNLTSPGSSAVHIIRSMPFGINSDPSGHPASVTVAAAAKGPFVPPEDLLISKVELGWKGSAATSAFRPAEPRKVIEMSLASTKMSSTSKHGRDPLNFDLNVPDERVLEEMASRDTTEFGSNRATSVNESSGYMPVVLGSGGLDLDLNIVDEANENGHCSTSSHCESGLPDRRRDFDLNDGLSGVDDEQLTINQQQFKGSLPFQLPSAAGLRMNSPPGLGSFYSSWFPPGNTHSTVAVPPVIPDRVGDQSFPIIPSGAPQRTFGPSAGFTPFTPDVYRGSILSSSPAVSFPSSHFQFPVFPFGASFPMPSATFSVGATSYADSSSGARLFAPSAANSQFLGPVGAISSQFQRPYLVSLPESSSIDGLDNRRWSRQGGLDLNTGPGAMGSEVREEILPLSLNQQSVTSSQALADEQARMYSVAGGILKRREPEGGWDNESFRYKQSSWR